jgi:hypothetical protein
VADPAPAWRPTRPGHPPGTWPATRTPSYGATPTPRPHPPGAPRPGPARPPAVAAPQASGDPVSGRRSRAPPILSDQGHKVDLLMNCLVSACRRPRRSNAPGLPDCLRRTSGCATWPSTTPTRIWCAASPGPALPPVTNQNGCGCSPRPEGSYAPRGAEPCTSTRRGTPGPRRSPAPTLDSAHFPDPEPAEPADPLSRDQTDPPERPYPTRSRTEDHSTTVAND